MAKTSETAAATGKFLAKRTICRASASSVRKLIRADRIRQGQRPRVRPNRLTIDDFFGPLRGNEDIFMRANLADRFKLPSPWLGTFARLHPTKGFRFGNAI